MPVPPFFWLPMLCRLAHIGQDDVLQRRIVHLPGGIEEGPVDTHQQRRLPIDVACFNHGVDAGHGRRIGAQTHEPLV